MLTNLETPNQWQPGYNPIIFRYESDLINQDNFEYLLKIDISTMGSGGTFSAWREIHEVSQPPRPDGTVTFDIHKFLGNELSYIFEPDKKDQVVSVLNSSNIHLKYRVRPYESYTTKLEWLFDRIYNNEDINAPIGDGFSLNFLPTQPEELPSPFIQGVNVIVNFDGTEPSGLGVDGRVLQVTSQAGATATQVNFEYPFGFPISASGSLSLMSSEIIQSPGVTSSELDTWNASYDFQDYNDFIVSPGTSATASDPNYIYNEVEMDKYFYRDLATDKLNYNFLTNLLNTGVKLLKEDYMWLNINPPEDALTLKVETSNGLYSFDLSNETTDLIKSETIQTLGVGPMNLILGTASATVIAGTLPIIDDSIEEYTFWLSDNKPTQGDYFSEKINIKIYDPCSIFENQSLIYLDPLGSMVPVNFYLTNKENINIKRTSYTKNYGNPRTNHNGDNRWGYDNWDRGKTNLDISYTQQFTITSDWVDDIENVRFRELLLSPEVYLLSGDEFLAINILDSTFKPKQRDIDMLFNYTIKYEYAQQNRTNI